MKKLLLTLAIPALIAGCGKDKDDKGSKPGKAVESGSDLGGMFQTMDASIITVTDINQQPVKGAQVLVGNALNTPFAGNFLTTNELGQVTVPAEWATNEPITVQAAGYMRATYMDQAPGAISFQLRTLVRKTQHEIKGVTNNLPIKEKDGFIDFGLVMPAMSRLDLLNFDIGSIISPHEDKISVLGNELKLPANLSIPKQSEKYNFLLTATLDKPLYRVYAPRSGITRMYVARGRFPFRETADELKGGKEIMDVVNSFTISGGGIRDMDVRGPVEKNLPTMDLNFTESKNVVAPTLRSDETFISAAIANQSGYMIPTDFKKLTTNQKLALNVLPGSKQFVLGILMKTDEMTKEHDRRSATLLPFIGGVSPKMLPLIGAPSVSRSEVVMPKISPVAGINPIATYAVLAKEEEVTQGAVKVKVMNPHWEVYAGAWVERLSLPQWPDDAGFTGKKRWEVNFVGSQTASQAPVGPAMIESATHVTHNSVNF